MSIGHIILSTLGLATKPKNKVDHEALLKERIEKQRAMREKHKANASVQTDIGLSTDIEAVEYLTLDSLTVEQSIYRQYLEGFSPIDFP